MLLTCFMQAETLNSQRIRGMGPDDELSLHFASARMAASRLRGVPLFCLFKKDDKYGLCGTGFSDGLHRRR